jgi:ABC-type Fe3+-hydroxamate transport system substrate-binding protein
MRLVSLCPSLTELVFDLGRGEALVGRTKFCVHPAGAVARVETVGGTKNPKVDRIIALAPDLVLMNEEENRREDADQLAAAGLTIHASMPRTADDTATMVRSIGAAIASLAPSQEEARRTTDRAEEVARQIEAEARRVRATAASRPSVRFAYLIWRGPWMVVGRDTFVDGLLSLAGGTNAFADRDDRYPTVTADEIRTASPDVVLLATEPFPFQDRHVDELVTATGVPRERFRIVDGELLSWHGSRTPRGIAYAGDLMTSIDPAGISR